MEIEEDEMRVLKADLYISYIYRVTNRKLPKLIVYNFEITAGKNIIKKICSLRSHILIACFALSFARL